MAGLLPPYFKKKNSDHYKDAVKQFGKEQVDEVIAQCDELESWVKEMPTKQLIMYVGCFHTFNKLPQSKAYVQENFPNVLENPFLFETLSAASHNELKINRGYKFKEKMLDEFYNLIELSEKDDEEYSEEEVKLPLWKKIYYVFIIFGIIMFIYRVINWLLF